MEVHTHTHTARKKWTHYFWEFIMLFLAVFCGFLAENQREHMVEHQREKQFMRLLVEDLANDTTELQIAIRIADTISRFSDSVVIYLRDHRPGNFIPLYMADHVGKGGMRQTLINTDRTSSQLKNSGAMRLIRSEDISTMIMRYWKQIEKTNISLDRYMVYRDASRELVFKLWVIPEIYYAGRAKKDSLQQLRLIDNDPKKWDELTNLCVMMGTITREAHARNLSLQLNLAIDLIYLIKTKYHFK